MFGKAADDQPSQRPTQPKSEMHRYNWLVAFKNELHNIKAVVEVAWIKAHVGFLGNEVADAFAKWIYYSCPPHPNQIPPPPPKGCISLNGIPLTNKLKKKDLSHLSPMHVHSAPHQFASYDWYPHSTSWTICHFSGHPQPCGLKVSRLTRTCSLTDVTCAMNLTPWIHYLC